ncbi:hypothetical protein [Methylobacterium soli]|uniref:Uncharacterized protein n=1 Tax=Methylobacterium soli TaxID=553447 RepID=A0A6L3SNH6_9HYPH|nr:hypothetical protein [Methylobacterium soli]KAB1068901.1 hypothetical protein F6X53_31230 [Methylobacterium soli]GJE43974.1 hypothetical protein AEGHOMDF_3160 [Methylobacterium soli]
MAESVTTQELIETGAISWGELWQAIDIFVSDPEADTVDLGARYSLNLHAAIDASVLAKDLLSKPLADEHLMRAAVRAAILLARPVKR